MEWLTSETSARLSYFYLRSIAENLLPMGRPRFRTRALAHEKSELKTIGFQFALDFV